MSIFSEILKLESSSYSGALCTVVEISGSTPRKPGAKMIVIEDGSLRGTIIGTIGGGAIEHLTRSQALECIKEKKAFLFETSLKHELGMCCGGTMKIFIEPLLKKPNLICFGAGHIAQALCPLAKTLGFEVQVADSRPELLNASAFEGAEQFPEISPFSFDELPFSEETHVVITTHDHQLDQMVVEKVLRKPFKYAALVGSKRKALMTKKRLLAKNFSSQLINRVICPAGLAINAQTPEEIAVSIMAQMIGVKNGTVKTHRADSSSGEK